MLTAESTHQLLQVLELTRRNHARGISLPLAYQDAIRDISGRHHVTYQTIGDLCRRRLGLSDINQFSSLVDRWLRGDGEALSRTIIQHTEPSAHAAVRRFFSGAAQSLEIAAPRPTIRESRPTIPDAESQRPIAAEELRLRLTADLSKRLQLAQLAKVGTTREETAIALIERGFEVERARIREFLDAI